MYRSRFRPLTLLILALCSPGLTSASGSELIARDAQPLSAVELLAA